MSSSTVTSTPFAEKITMNKTTDESRAPQQSSKPMAKRLRDHLLATIEPTALAEIELLILTFCTGIQDATTFPDYHCFASNQTGNTVFLTLAVTIPRVAGQLFVTANIGAALGLFLFAGWLTGQLSHRIGPRNRLWLVFCNAIQSFLVFGAAAVQYKHGVQVEGTNALVVVSLLAFAAGSQVVQSRSLAMTEISTAMATAAWVDLMIDPKLFILSNRPRTRRVGFLLALVAGSFVGASIYRSAGSATAIVLSATGKLLVTVMFLFNASTRSVRLDSSV